MVLSQQDLYRQKLLMLHKFQLQMSLSEPSRIFTAQFCSFLVSVTLPTVSDLGFALVWKNSKLFHVTILALNISTLS